MYINIAAKKFSIKQTQGNYIEAEADSVDVDKLLEELTSKVVLEKFVFKLLERFSTSEIMENLSQVEIAEYVKENIKSEEIFGSNKRDPIENEETVSKSKPIKNLTNEEV